MKAIYSEGSPQILQMYTLINAEKISVDQRYALSITFYGKPSQNLHLPEARDIDNISSTVVREGIQNSLDERHRDKTEMVRKETRSRDSGIGYLKSANESIRVFDSL